MAKALDFLFYFFALLLAFSIVMVVFSLTSPKFSGFATSASTTSNVTISTYFAISISNNLTSGIRYGTVTSIPVTFINGSSNYDAGAGINGSTYYANVSTDSNSLVDFCLNANNALRTSGADIIGVNNQTYSNASTSIDITSPSIGAYARFSTTPTKASAPTGQGNATYFRFWLDIPAATPAGTYNNSITISAVTTGAGC